MFAAVLGALIIAFSGILVKLADVPPATAAVFRCATRCRSWCCWRAPSAAPTARAPPRRSAGLAGGHLLRHRPELYHHTIGLVGAGLATVLGNTQVVFVAVLA